MLLSPSLSEVHAALQLGQAIRCASSTEARKRTLVLGLCELVGASTGICVTFHHDRKSQRKTILSVVKGSIDGAEPAHLPALDSIESELLGSSEETAPARSKHDGSRGDGEGEHGTNDHHLWASRTFCKGTCIHSILHIGGTGLTANVRICAARKRCGSRQRAIVDLVHREVGWIYRADLPLASPEALALSPRQRDVLDLLLNGDSVKQIAGKLKLSHNTVHHHVKGIHRHFCVNSRSELLARWVGK